MCVCVCGGGGGGGCMYVRVSAGCGGGGWGRCLMRNSCMLILCYDVGFIYLKKNKKSSI